MDYFWLLVFTFPLWTPVLLNKGRPQLIGSPQPILVAQGGDVVLPCYVEPRTNVEDHWITWWKPDIQLDPADPRSNDRYVHCYHDNRDEEDLKMPSYAGRTALCTEELKHGNASLKIRNVKLSDQGWYQCDFRTLMRDTHIQLVVEPNSDKIWTIETPQTQAPTDETDVKGVQLRLMWFPPVVLSVLLILAGVGYRLKHKCQIENDLENEMAPTKSSPV